MSEVRRALDHLASNMNRADRRRAGRVTADGLVCPECGSRQLGWLTQEEFLEHARMLGRPVRVEAGTLAEASWLPAYQWWWCHECEIGGLLCTA